MKSSFDPSLGCAYPQEATAGREQEQSSLEVQETKVKRRHDGEMETVKRGKGECSEFQPWTPA